MRILLLFLLGFISGSIGFVFGFVAGRLGLVAREN